MRIPTDMSRWLRRSLLILVFTSLIIVSSTDSLPTSLKPSSSDSVQKNAVVEMISRLIPKYSSFFHITINSGQNTHYELRQTFTIETKRINGTQVFITANSGVAAAAGFNYYLKYYCNCHVSWSGDQLKFSQALPVVKPIITITSYDRLRYYQNVCTSSYSFVWWNWTRWEREIDWMALNGINLPLAFTGQEEMWLKTYTSFGFTEQDLEDFFTGPAFLAWGRMGNIQGWGGPLPRMWMQQQLILQHKILKRMREFGMIPVLPAFAGHVPRAFQRLYPDANVSILDPDGWGHFHGKYCCTLFLDPADPLFTEIGAAFIEKMKAEFGVDHIYNADVFNEMTPSSSDPAYLANTSKAVFASMTAADEDAVWLMQGWMFYADSQFWKLPQAKAVLTSIPIGRMIVLDLQAEVVPQYKRLKSFFGQPFIWCMLHNYGGVLGLYGAVDNLNNFSYEARIFPNTSIYGTGIAPEGIEQNDVMYDFMNEIGFRKGAISDLSVWFKHYAQRRYGSSTSVISQSWKLLMTTVYNCTLDFRMHGKFIIVRRPSLKLVPGIWYDTDLFFKAWDGFVASAEKFRGVETFEYDLVDVTRQALQLIGAFYYSDLVVAYKNKNVTALCIAGITLLDVLNDLESILASNSHFLLGNWLDAAKDKGNGSKEQEILYEYNARNQITLWGPEGNILDYATKQWSGIIVDYYKPRWQLFINNLKKCLAEHVKFNQSAFNDEVFELIEKPFTFANNSYPSKPKGDSIEIAQLLHTKYMNSTYMMYGRFVKMHYRFKEYITMLLLRKRNNKSVDTLE